jgi:hypothetical protein
VDEWIKQSAAQADIPPGTKGIIQNWQKYKAFLRAGMQELFGSSYYWKIPQDAVCESVPQCTTPSYRVGSRRPKKNSGQVPVEVLPNGHYVLHNYRGGTPFPQAAEPYKGWKIQANANWLQGRECTSILPITTARSGRSTAMTFVIKL